MTLPKPVLENAIDNCMITYRMYIKNLNYISKFFTNMHVQCSNCDDMVFNHRIILKTDRDAMSN